MIREVVNLFIVAAAIGGEPSPANPPPGGDSSSRAPDPEMPLFETDFAAALARAKSEGKILLVEFYSPQCTHCRRMQITVYRRQEVIDFSSKVVWLRIDQTQGEGVTLRRRFHAGPTPMYMAIGHDGESAFYRFNGALSPKGFMHNLELMTVSAAECESVRAAIENEKPTLAQRLTLAKGELMAGRLEAGKNLLQAIADDDPANESQLVDDALTLLGMVKISESPRYGPWQAYVDWEKVVKQHTKSDRAPDAVMYIAKMLQASGDQTKHPKLGALIKDYPQGVDAVAAAKVLEEK